MVLEIDIFDIKAQNVKRILDVVRQKGHMTKKEIAAQTDLSFATVSNLCNELTEIGVLASTKKEGMTVGRTPNDLTLCAAKFNTICINLQMEEVMNFAVQDLNYHVVFEKKYDISGFATAEEIIGFAKRMFDTEFPQEDKQGTSFIGVGVAVSSIFDIKSERLINCAIEKYTGVALKEIVERIFQLPAYVDNEANLCALSVSHRELEDSNLVYLYISQGVGVGIICQDKLLRGARGYAGEVAHMPIGDPEIQCPTCGQRGCVEAQLSIPGFLRRISADGQPSAAKGWPQFLDQIRSGNPQALRLAQQNGVLMGKLISVLINLFDPSVLYIGGDIAAVYPYIQNDIQQELARRCLLGGEDDLKIRTDLKSDETINVGISEEIYNNWAETILHDQPVSPLPLQP